MYTVTFYSFKGGVGRTMALTNVAFELARQGQRVLVVDFDLEAPSLGAFGLPLSRKISRRSTPGLVEYVSDYLKTGSVPVVTEFISEIKDTGSEGGRLWLMTAGKADAEYSARLGQINWKNLYEENDGYVFFEELKAQWQHAYDPDYVLIDSRTGYTDVAGICTRQLPDAVVCMFYPNRQNLRGLQHVVETVRGEAQSAREKQIELHFVMANVPNLDDEEDILATRRKEFRRALGMTSGPMLIHHYDSLAVLTTAVFTQEKPKTRIAREYRRLAAVIRQRNPADVGGSLQWLESAWQGLVTDGLREQPSDFERRLEQILVKHGAEGAVLSSVARIRIRQARLEEAQSLLERALALGHSRPRVYLLLAEVRQRLGERQGAGEAASAVLARYDATVHDIIRSIQIFRFTAPERVSELARSTAGGSLSASEVLWLSEVLRYSELEASQACDMLSKAIARSESLAEEERDADVNALRQSLVLCLVRLGRFEQAETMCRLLVEKMGKTLHLLFNYAMANWGHMKTPSLDLFGNVWEEFDNVKGDSQNANYFQCYALTAFVIGERDQAITGLSDARSALLRRAVPQFSCWRYLDLSPRLFVSDLEAMEQWMLDTGPGPEVFRERLGEVAGTLGASDLLRRQ